MSKAVILTPAHIERLKSGALADREVPGLSIIVAGAARKQWRFKRVVAGTKKTVELVLGIYPAFSIDEAREWAGPLSKAVARGEDPRETKRAEEAMAMSVADAHAIYMDAMRRGDRKKLKPRTILDKDKMYSRDIGPRIGSKILSELTEDECWDAVYDKAKRKIGHAAEDELIAMAARYAASRWIVPISPRCLVDALALDRILLRRGLAATLVFGVRINPPWRHVAEPNPLPLGEIAPELEQRLLASVAAWAEGREDIVVELSGGLDSSIVAAALAGSGAAMGVDHLYGARCITCLHEGDDVST